MFSLAKSKPPITNSIRADPGFPTDTERFILDDEGVEGS